MYKLYFKLLMKVVLFLFLVTSISFCDTQTSKCSNTVYTESEANEGASDAGATSLAGTSTNDTGITTTQGCTYTINGTTEALGTYDYFAFNTGIVPTFRVYVTWDTASDALDLSIHDAYDESLTQQDAFGTWVVAESWLTGDYEDLTWNVALSSTTRYIVIINNIAGASYTITLQGL